MTSKKKAYINTLIMCIGNTNCLPMEKTHFEVQAVRQLLRVIGSTEPGILFYTQVLKAREVLILGDEITCLAVSSFVEHHDGETVKDLLHHDSVMSNLTFILSGLTPTVDAASLIVRNTHIIVEERCLEDLPEIQLGIRNIPIYVKQ